MTHKIALTVFLCVLLGLSGIGFAVFPTGDNRIVWCTGCNSGAKIPVFDESIFATVHPNWGNWDTSDFNIFNASPAGGGQPESWTSTRWFNNPTDPLESKLSFDSVALDANTLTIAYSTGTDVNIRFYDWNGLMTVQTKLCDGPVLNLYTPVIKKLDVNTVLAVFNTGDLNFAIVDRNGEIAVNQTITSDTVDLPVSVIPIPDSTQFAIIYDDGDLGQIILNVCDRNGWCSPNYDLNNDTDADQGMWGAALDSQTLVTAWTSTAPGFYVSYWALYGLDGVLKSPIYIMPNYNESLSNRGSIVSLNSRKFAIALVNQFNSDSNVVIYNRNGILLANQLVPFAGAGLDDTVLEKLNDHQVIFSSFETIWSNGVSGYGVARLLNSDANLLRVQFWDESTQTKLVPSTLTLNDVNTLAYLDENGLLELPTYLLNEGYYTVKANKTNYTERTWTVWLDPAQTYDYNFSLLATSLGQDVPFEFYKPDGTTRIASTLVEVWNTDGNFISSIIFTNALGQVSYFLNAQDENYHFEFSFGGTNYDYGETLVTVKIPKSEQTLEEINPWDLKVGGISNWDFNGLTTDKNIYVFSDLYGYHYFDVNAANYFERYYALRFKGGVVSYELQPYLVPTSLGLISVVRVVSPVNQVAVSNVEIRLYRNLSSGVRANVETVVTDSKGESLISGVINQTYEAEIYYNGTKIGTFDITITSSLWVLIFNPASLPTLPEGASASVNFSPGGGQLDGNTTALTQSIYISNASISSIEIFFYDANLDANLYAVTFASPTTSFSNNVGISTDLASWDSNHVLTVTVQIIFSDGNVLVRKTSYSKYDASKLASQYLELWKTGIRPIVGCPATGVCGFLILLSGIFTLLICGALIAATPLRDPAGISGMSALILGFFVYLEWVPLFWYVLMCVVLFGFMISKWRVES